MTDWKEVIDRSDGPDSDAIARWKKVDDVPWITVNDSYRKKSFPCPVCDADLLGVSKVNLGLLKGKRTTANIECDCHHKHPGRDSGVLGCGWQGIEFEVK